MPSPILVGDEIYYIDDKGIGSCLDAHTGKVHWMERVGGEFSASPTYGDGKLYFPSQYGKTLVLKPGKALDILAENELKGNTWPPSPWRTMRCSSAQTRRCTGSRSWLESRTEILTRLEKTTFIRFSVHLSDGRKLRVPKMMDHQGDTSA